MNTGQAVNCVWLDCDHQRWQRLLARCLAAGMPAPAWVSSSQRGAHLVWLLRTPVVIGGNLAVARRAARLLSVTVDYLRRALEGDGACSLRGLMKNPFCGRWETSVADDVVPVDLLDLLRPLERLARAEGWHAPAYKKAPRADDDGGAGRQGARLFDATRFWAYRNGTTDVAALEAYAAEQARLLGSPATPGQIRQVARSIARFMATRWAGRRRPALPSGQRRAHQAQAGRTTAQGRTARRECGVAQAMAALGPGATRAEIAAAAGCSPRTVSRSAAWLARANGQQPVAATAQAALTSVGAEGETGDDVAIRSVVSGGSTVTLSLTAGTPAEALEQLALIEAVAGGGRKGRRAWHCDALLHWPATYTVLFSLRLQQLEQQRARDLAQAARLGDTPDRLMACPLGLDERVRRTFLAAEQVRRVALGWASRLRAEQRCYRRAMGAMPFLVKG